jgi:lysophospholipase L1-like esterase
VIGRGGLVALGDSITVGSAAAPPWVRWLAEALDLPWTSLAFNGAGVADALHEQLPRVASGHAVACLYAGVNDARGFHFDPVVYERDLLAVAQGLRPLSDTLLLCTLPLDLGRPPAAPKPAIANEAVRRVARATGALVCALDDFGGPAHVLADAVHPTRAGQIEIAERAVRALRLKSG